MPTRAADNAGFRDRRIEYARGSEPALQPDRGLENAALPFHVLQVRLRCCNRPRPRRSTTIRSSRAISSASVAETISTMVRGSPEKCGTDSKREEVGSTSGEYRFTRMDSFGGRFRREGLVGRFANFPIDFRFDGFQFLFVDDSFAHQKQAEFGNGVAMRLFLPQRVRLVELSRRRKANASRVA